MGRAKKARRRAMAGAARCRLELPAVRSNFFGLPSRKSDYRAGTVCRSRLRRDGETYTKSDRKRRGARLVKRNVWITKRFSGIVDTFLVYTRWTTCINSKRPLPRNLFLCSFLSFGYFCLWLLLHLYSPFCQ